MRCPHCAGMRVLIDRFDHMRHADCWLCGGKGKVKMPIENEMQEFERLMTGLGIESREKGDPYVLDDILFGMARRIIELERQVANNEGRTDEMWDKLMRWPYPWTEGGENL